MTENIWNKPVICIFKERDIPEVEPFVVIKARKLVINQTNNSLTGSIQDFFKLMGSIDYLSSTEGINDHYVLCWFDDTIPEMTGDFRKIFDACFGGNVKFEVNKNGKRTYNAVFTAKHAKLC
ncbi:MAG: hypothetical protein FWH37_02200 [Candidatus Bathyarchaeota archaeon]|nr:hypothetical protein [Candidatus Termiticorpusculum sp.]